MTVRWASIPPSADYYFNGLHNRQSEIDNPMPLLRKQLHPLGDKHAALDAT